MIRRIIQMPDKRLRQVSVPVVSLPGESFELAPEIKTVIDDLLATRISGRGAALAAPQIGEHVRVVVVDPKLFYGFLVLINPEIIERGKQIVSSSEGCMSIGMGTIKFTVKRNQVVTVRFITRNGTEKIVVAKGLPACLIQHEIDHLDGKMIA